MSNLQEERWVTSANTMANAVELSTQVIMKVAGHEVANTVNGELLTPRSLNEAVAARINARLQKKGVNK